VPLAQLLNVSGDASDPYALVPVPSHNTSAASGGEKSLVRGSRSKLGAWGGGGAHGQTHPIGTRLSELHKLQREREGLMDECKRLARQLVLVTDENAALRHAQAQACRDADWTRRHALVGRTGLERKMEQHKERLQHAEAFARTQAAYIEQLETRVLDLTSISVHVAAQRAEHSLVGLATSAGGLGTGLGIADTSIGLGIVGAFDRWSEGSLATRAGRKALALDPPTAKGGGAGIRGKGSRMTDIRIALKSHPNPLSALHPHQPPLRLQRHPPPRDAPAAHSQSSNPLLILKRPQRLRPATSSSALPLATSETGARTHGLEAQSLGPHPQARSPTPHACPVHPMADLSRADARPLSPRPSPRVHGGGSGSGGDDEVGGGGLVAGRAGDAGAGGEGEKRARAVADACSEQSPEKSRRVEEEGRGGVGSGRGPHDVTPSKVEVRLLGRSRS
jgi:hypothetical protein